MILVDREELYKEFRKDIMGGLNWEYILRTAKPYGLNIKENNMTAQKVCDILIRIIDEDWHVYTDDAIEALTYAAKVVDKEIPRKPIRDKGLYTCPSCYSTFNTVDSAYEQYCPFCGQKLDWEKKDEDV